MIKGKFIDESLRLLAGGTYTVGEFRFSRQDVSVLIDPAIGFVVKKNFFENYNLGEEGAIDPGFLTTFEDVAVSFSDLRNNYYSDLPHMVVGLPKDYGVYEISPMQDQGSAFIPMLPGNAGLFKGLAAEDLFGEVGFRREGMKIWYKGMNTTDKKYTSVLMNLVCSTDHLSMDDELPIPLDYLDDVMNAVIEKIGGVGLQRKPDTKIDANRST